MDDSINNSKNFIVSFHGEENSNVVELCHFQMESLL